MPSEALVILIVVAFVILIVVTVLVVALRRVRNPRIRDGVEGLLLVTGASPFPHGSGLVSAHIIGTISGPGIMPTAIDRQLMARTSKWPVAGQQLPVLVDPAQPTRFRVLWDQVPTGGDIAMQQAAQFAQAAPSGFGPGGSTATPGGGMGQGWGFGPGAAQAESFFTSTTVNGQPFAGAPIDQRDIAAAMNGDLSGLFAAVFDGGGPSAPASQVGMGTVTGFTNQPGAPQVVPGVDVISVLFDLTVTPASGGSGFPATLVANFSSSSPRRTAWCRTGAQIPVRFDPANPGQVQLDLSRV